MIKYDPKSWFSLIFRFHKSDTFQQMAWVLLAYSIFSSIIVYLDLEYGEKMGFHSTITIHSLMGFVIGLLLVFRTNTAYDRWWEGRKQWGALVNNTRNFAIKIHAVVPHEDKALRLYFRTMIPNFVFAMKEHLRKGVKLEELETNEQFSLEQLKGVRHVPNAISKDMNTKLHKMYRDGMISGDQLIVMDKELKAFLDILGACERIRNTPIPFSYSLFLKKFIFLYTITLPLGLAIDFKYWTIPIAASILYVFGSVEILAEEIEDPFGLDTNDLPTDNLANKIQANVNEILDRP